MRLLIFGEEKRGLSDTLGHQGTSYCLIRAKQDILIGDQIICKLDLYRSGLGSPIY